MIDETELVALVDRLEAEALHDWIRKGWVRPKRIDPAPRFDDADVARVRLICELRYELSIEEESLPVVLSLMDQVYGLRRTMRAFAAAVEAQPGDVRGRIAEMVRTTLEKQR